MNNLKVAHKLLILNIVSLIGMLVIAMFGYTSIQTAKEDIDKMFNDNLMSIYYVGDSKFATRYSQLQACLLPLMDTDAEYQSRKQKY